MRKLSIKFLSVILSFLLLLFSVLLVSANDNTKTYVTNSYSKQYESTKQNNKILNYFKTNIIKTRQSFDPLNIELSYPNYYGGSYLDENGELNILLTRDEKNIKENLKSISENKELLFREASFSYSELTEIINSIMLYQENYYKNTSVDNSYDIAKDIVDCTLDDKNNKVIVGIREIDNDKIELFKNNIIDSTAIEFIKREYTPKQINQIDSSNKIDKLNITTNLPKSITVRPGMQLTSSLASYYSLGFPVYRTITSGKEYGFVTAGHKLSIGNYFTDISTAQKVGTVKLNRVGGKYDVSFVALNSGVTCSDNIKDTAYSLYPSNEEIDSPVYGKLVYSYGSVNYSNGKITTTNYSYYNDELGVSFSGMVGADYRASAGDSGGLVASSGADNYTKIQEGITCGGMVLDNNSIIGSYYCSAVNIVNLWYLVCY